MRGVWATWMRVWCWGVLAFGVLLTTVAVPGFDGPARALYELFSGGGENAAAFGTNPVRFGLGLQGALTIGWAVTMMAMVRAADTLGAPIWRAMTLALVLWYVIDSAISITTGFALNAVSNTTLMVAYLIPVLASGALKRA